MGYVEIVGEIGEGWCEFMVLIAGIRYNTFHRAEDVAVGMEMCLRSLGLKYGRS